ncbi:elastin-like [Elephas maximus indicus]|uniref:elastin-like n=1 Tax=Elephas maximus indicus TaxID=99487 RepID=UPI002116D499|nr:elastin-like [Elephas maximus indicus]
MGARGPPPVRQVQSEPKSSGWDSTSAGRGARKSPFMTTHGPGRPNFLEEEGERNGGSGRGCPGQILLLLRSRAWSLLQVVLPRRHSNENEQSPSWSNKLKAVDPWGGCISRAWDDGLGRVHFQGPGRRPGAGALPRPGTTAWGGCTSRAWDDGLGRVHFQGLGGRPGAGPLPGPGTTPGTMAWGGCTSRAWDDGLGRVHFQGQGRRPGAGALPGPGTTAWGGCTSRACDDGLGRVHFQGLRRRPGAGAPQGLGRRPEAGALPGPGRTAWGGCTSRAWDDAWEDGLGRVHFQGLGRRLGRWPGAGALPGPGTTAWGGCTSKAWDDGLGRVHFQGQGRRPGAGALPGPATTAWGGCTSRACDDGLGRVHSKAWDDGLRRVHFQGLGGRPGAGPLPGPATTPGTTAWGGCTSRAWDDGLRRVQACDDGLGRVHFQGLGRRPEAGAGLRRRPGAGPGRTAWGGSTSRACDDAWDDGLGRVHFQGLGRRPGAGALPGPGRTAWGGSTSRAWDDAWDDSLGRVHFQGLRRRPGAAAEQDPTATEQGFCPPTDSSPASYPIEERSTRDDPELKKAWPLASRPASPAPCAEGNPGAAPGPTRGSRLAGSRTAPRTALGLGQSLSVLQSSGGSSRGRRLGSRSPATARGVLPGEALRLRAGDEPGREGRRAKGESGGCPGSRPALQRPLQPRLRSGLGAGGCQSLSSARLCRRYPNRSRGAGRGDIARAGQLGRAPRELWLQAEQPEPWVAPSAAAPAPASPAVRARRRRLSPRGGARRHSGSRAAGAGAAGAVAAGRAARALGRAQRCGARSSLACGPGWALAAVSHCRRPAPVGATPIVAEGRGEETAGAGQLGRAPRELRLQQSSPSLGSRAQRCGARSSLACGPGWALAAVSHCRRLAPVGATPIVAEGRGEETAGAGQLGRAPRELRLQQSSPSLGSRPALRRPLQPRLRSGLGPRGCQSLSSARPCRRYTNRSRGAGRGDSGSRAAGAGVERAAAAGRAARASGAGRAARGGVAYSPVWETRNIYKYRDHLRGENGVIQRKMCCLSRSQSLLYTKNS